MGRLSKSCRVSVSKTASSSIQQTRSRKGNRFASATKRPEPTTHEVVGHRAYGTHRYLADSLHGWSEVPAAGFSGPREMVKRGPLGCRCASRCDSQRGLL